MQTCSVRLLAFLERHTSGDGPAIYGPSISQEGGSYEQCLRSMLVYGPGPLPSRHLLGCFSGVSVRLFWVWDTTMFQVMTLAITYFATLMASTPQ